MGERFDDWSSVVDCNGCDHYQSNRCDGVKVGEKRRCESYVAVRRIDLPARLKVLEDQVIWLTSLGAIYTGVLIAMVVAILLLIGGVL